MIKHLTHNRILEIVITITAVSLCGITLILAYRNNLITTLSDQAAHLVFSRLLIDSLTPGITQLGLWPPLLHIIMLPATAITPLFTSGLSGFLTLLPIFILGAILLFRLCYILSDDKLISFTCSILYISNPYILYYTATPMMEVLFITMVIGVSYYLVRWLTIPRLRYLILSGCFITLASLSRYEGLFLLPAVFLILTIHLLIKKYKYSKTEAILIIFSIPALLGLGYLIIYSWAFSDHPFSFAGIGIKYGFDVGNYASTGFTKFNIYSSIKYVLFSSFYLLGEINVITSLFCFIFVILFMRKRNFIVPSIFIMIVPFLAVILAVFRGSNSIDLPIFPPYKYFHNERYAMSLILFVVLNQVFFIKLISYKFRILKLILCIVIILYYFIFWYETAVLNNFAVIRGNSTAKQRNSIDGMALLLKQNYDYGEILATRYNNDFTYVDSGVNLRNYIYEGNYKYFDQALNTPWLFARYVIMLNPNSFVTTYTRDPIMEKWGADKLEVFNKYYIKIGEDQGRIFYKVNEVEVLEYSKQFNLNYKQIPSVNPSIKVWNTESIWVEMSTKDSNSNF